MSLWPNSSGGVPVEELKRLAWMNSELHGPKHWARVARFGARLAEVHGFDEQAQLCIELFGWTHDLARTSDGGNPEHGPDGAWNLQKVIEELELEIPHESYRVVKLAIRHHNDGLVAEEGYHQGLFEGLEWDKASLLLTIGACWDADRLDLMRLGMEPRPSKMSTPCWEEVLPLAREIHGFR